MKLKRDDAVQPRCSTQPGVLLSAQCQDIVGMTRGRAGELEALEGVVLYAQQHPGASLAELAKDVDLA